MTRNSETFSITRTDPGTLSFDSVPFLDIKNHILGEEYELSLVFVDDDECQKLNREYREKDYPTNVLSFPLSETSGEIFINVDALEREARDFEREEDKFAGYLFIHGLFHLKGFDHGSTMESEEEKVRTLFHI